MGVSIESALWGEGTLRSCRMLGCPPTRPSIQSTPPFGRQKLTQAHNLDQRATRALPSRFRSRQVLRSLLHHLIHHAGSASKVGVLAGALGGLPLLPAQPEVMQLPRTRHLQGEMVADQRVVRAAQQLQRAQGAGARARALHRVVDLGGAALGGSCGGDCGWCALCRWWCAFAQHFASGAVRCRLHSGLCALLE